jgi:hypothetical protein
MKHGLCFMYLLDAFDGTGAKHNRKDHRRAAELAATRTRIGFWAWVSAKLCLGLAVFGLIRPRRPESLDEAIARLANVSPHLLDDIGIAADHYTSDSRYVSAARGTVRIGSTSGETKVSSLPANAEKPLVKIYWSIGQPIIGFVPAKP